ncbi:MAG: hypothetical protein V1906_00025 [Candidatus Woesearchaeota archaeon]
MFKKIFGILGMLLLLASFVAAAPSVKVTNLNPGADENITCYVDGTTAGFDFYWYKGQTRLLSAGDANSLTLPDYMTEPATTYTCKVFRPSSNYVPELLIGSVSVKTKDNPKTQCSDSIDNDGDGKVDMSDPGCESPQDDDEFNWYFYPLKPFDYFMPFHLPECSDLKDNDGDGKVDMLDPGCSSPSDDDETNTVHVPQCSDKRDNDGDGLVDMLDPGCSSPSDDDETNIVHVPQCSDKRDNDGDGLIDMRDPGCSSPLDDDETNTVHVPQCSDKRDNDGDNKIDMLDPGCSNPLDNDESDDPDVPECSDDVDNDGDGEVDMDDPGCDSSSDDDETDDEDDNGDADKPFIEIDDVALQVKDGKLKVSVVVYNSGNGMAKNVELLYSVSKLKIVDYDGVGTIKAKQYKDVLHFIDLKDAKAGKYTVMIEAYDDKGNSDVIYRTFEVAEDKLTSDVLVTYNVINDNVEPAAPLGFFARIVKWFADLFALIWG